MPEAEGAELDDCFVDVDSVRIHYLCAGAGRPLVMVHGLTGSTHNWLQNIEVLGRAAHVYAIDLPNMGQSGRLAGLDVGLMATADRVAAWMNAMGLEEADIAGHSHGGAVAMMLAARFPQRVRSLILFAPANPYNRSADHLLRLYSSAPGRLLGRMAPFLPRMIQMIALRRMYGDPARIKRGFLEGYIVGLKVHGTMEHILKIIHSWHDEMRALGAVLPKLKDVPVMLVWGDRDRAVSLESGQRLSQELPRSEWHVVPGAGHVPFEELPEICNELMLRWLERLNLPGYQVELGAETTRPTREVRRVAPEELRSA